MKQVKLTESIFQIEKLANVVGIGNCAAFQVVIAPGKNIGVMGKVIDPSDINSHNDPVFSAKSSASFGTNGLGSWLKRSLTALGR
jgi:hypothetical protein